MKGCGGGVELGIIMCSAVSHIVFRRVWLGCPRLGFASDESVGVRRDFQS